MRFEKQHYLSQFYLKGFGKRNSNPKSEAIQNWVYFINEKKVKLKEPKNIAYKSHMYSKIKGNKKYDHTLEKYFGDIENAVAPLFIKISDQVKKWNTTNSTFNFEQKDKILLILFVFWSMKKTPAIKEKIVHEIHRKIKDDIGVNYLLYSSEISEFVNKSYVDSIPNLDGNNDLEMFNILLNKNIYFITSSSGTSFLTSDNPVVVFNPTGTNGIIHERSEIYFALNHEILLMLHESGSTVRIFSLPDEEQKEVNKLIAKNANELIVSFDKENLVSSQA
jgi:hypothetical protein